MTIMYNTAYFDMCNAHPNTKKNELDHFCIDCLLALCYHCLPAHSSHKHVKIRRYVYCEVINRKDLCKLFNCSGIQAYHTNKTKVLFLKQRHQQPLQQQQSQQHNSKDHSCIICQRSLQDSTSLYCSIACKVFSISRGASDHDNEKDEDLGSKRSDEEIVTQSSPKRQKVRKGVAQRAPMY
ncbi:unnamed protein product [Camellia sinensis]